MPDDRFLPLKDYLEISQKEMIERSRSFYSSLRKRRSVRTFSEKTFPLEILMNCLGAAASAPSGANMQPWHFVVVSDPEIKKRIRAAAEREEREFYSSRATQEWLDDLKPLGTDSEKPFLEKAPYLIVIFEKKYEEINGRKKKLYYTKESVGIAAGMLINAIHQSGLASLTHTPSPMNFLNDLCQRPKNEKPFLLLVAGYPAEGTVVPDIQKKSLDEITTYL